MIDIDRLINEVHSRFDEVFMGGHSLIVCPMGGLMDLTLKDAEHFESIYCLEDKNPGCNEKYGYPVKAREEIFRTMDDDCKVVILSSLHYNQIKEEYLKYVSEDRILPYANYDTRIHFNYSDQKYKKWLKTHKETILAVYDALADERSKRSFEFLLKGAEHYSAAELLDMGGYSETEHPDNFHKFDFFPLSERENYLDVGAYDGDTIKDFLRAVGGHFKSITAVEPDSELFEKLNDVCGKIEGKVRCLKVGLGDRASSGHLNISENKFMSELKEGTGGPFEIKTIDSLGEDFSLIKISVCGTGVRQKILKGGMKLLKEKKPKLIVLIERYEDDILNIAKEILEINPDYKIFLRFMVWQQGDSFRLNCAYWAI